MYRRSIYRAYKKCAYTMLKSALSFLKKIAAKIARTTPPCPIKQANMDKLFYEKLDTSPIPGPEPSSGLTFLDRMKAAGNFSSKMFL